MAKAKYITSPRGTYKFPKLNEPDYGTKTYPDEDGSYNVRLVLAKDGPEYNALMKKIQPVLDEAIAEGEEKFAAMAVGARKKLIKDNGEPGYKVNDVYSIEYDKDTEEETGDVSFRFKMKAGGERKKGPKAGTRWSRKPIVYDARGNLMAHVPDIWGGTIGKVTFSTRPYFVSGSGAVGLTLQLEAIQIIDLVSGGSRAASDYGFEEEDGYEHDDDAFKPSNEGADSDDEFSKSDGGDDDAEADF